jgi:hypothetical protein
LLQTPKLDPLQPLVAEVIADILAAGDTVTPLDVLVRLEVIDTDQVAAWRSGALPYLERGVTSGLARVARILRLLQAHCLALGLQPTPGKYRRRGKGPNQKLRFSKRGDAASELAYLTHFVRRGSH